MVKLIPICCQLTSSVCTGAHFVILPLHGHIAQYRQQNLTFSRNCLPNTVTFELVRSQSVSRTQLTMVLIVLVYREQCEHETSLLRIKMPKLQCCQNRDVRPFLHKTKAIRSFFRLSFIQTVSASSDSSTPVFASTSSMFPLYTASALLLSHSWNHPLFQAFQAFFAVTPLDLNLFQFFLRH